MPGWAAAPCSLQLRLVLSLLIYCADPHWQPVISSSQGFSAWMPVKKALPPGAEMAASGCGISTSNQLLSLISGKQIKDIKVMSDSLLVFFLFCFLHEFGYRNVAGQPLVSWATVRMNKGTCFLFLLLTFSSCFLFFPSPLLLILDLTVARGENSRGG